MVEVFRTNVTKTVQATTIVALIQEHFDGYRVNFDLDDCDRILRVDYPSEVKAKAIIALLQDLGFEAAVLPDEPAPSAKNYCGSLKNKEMKKIIQSMIINASTDTLWDVLTNPVHIKHYFFGIDTVTDWREGSPISMKGVHKGMRYEHKGEVLEVNHGKLLKFTYFNSLEGYEDLAENYSVITYTLEPYGNQKTRFTYEKAKVPSEIEYQSSARYLPVILEEIRAIAEQSEKDNANHTSNSKS